MVKFFTRSALPLLICTGMLFGCNEKPATSPVSPSADAELAITLTPWIDPERILGEFFTVTSHVERLKVIFSGVRSELAAALHRGLTPSDNLLVVYKIYDGPHLQGLVVPQKIKGSTGSLEIVVVLGEDGQVLAVKFQKYRGSEPVHEELNSKFLPLLKTPKTMQNRSLDILSEGAREDAVVIQEAVDSIVTKLRLAGDNPKVIQQHDDHDPGSNKL